VSVQKDGQVVAALPNNQTKVLGKLHVVSVPKLKSADGLHFDLDGASDVANVGECLLPGHLEFGLPPEGLALKAHAAAQKKNLATAIELALAQPLPGPALPGPATPNAEPPAKSIVLAAEVSLAVTQLKALGIVVESTPGQTVIPVGTRPEERQRAVANLTKVLQGLLKRMSISQQNYLNANKVRDEQGQLNPYRRKLVKVGPEGQLVEDEDPSEFRKELKPGHPDARPDGNVIYPNVNRKVEKADFESAAAEYQLLRTALERLAPMTIFPEAPVLPALPPEPEEKKP
jgi:flagellar basal body rod protein FlgC